MHYNTFIRHELPGCGKSRELVLILLQDDSCFVSLALQFKAHPVDYLSYLLLKGSSNPKSIPKQLRQRA